MNKILVFLSLELHFNLICTCSVLPFSPLLYVSSVTYYEFVSPFFHLSDILNDIFFLILFFFSIMHFLSAALKVCCCLFFSHSNIGTHATHRHISGLAMWSLWYLINSSHLNFPTTCCKNFCILQATTLFYSF